MPVSFLNDAVLAPMLVLSRRVVSDSESANVILPTPSLAQLYRIPGDSHRNRVL